MLGYYDDAAATHEALADGWFHTGDLGYVSDDGYVFITGRKKNLIILSNGKNVSAEELEGRLSRIDGVSEVVVTGEDDRIVAEVYSKEGRTVDADVEELNRRLPPYKRIAEVRYRDTEFPKTTTQKIKR
jgi:long-chain acyl-CoA synthetase